MDAETLVHEVKNQEDNLKFKCDKLLEDYNKATAAYEAVSKLRHRLESEIARGAQRTVKE
jgi:hypothetical protein